MGKHRRIAFILAFIALLGGLAWFVMGRGEPEPVYQGKALSQWLNAYRIKMDPSGGLAAKQQEWDQADNAVRAIGTKGIPVYLRMLRSRDSALKRKLLEYTDYHPIPGIHIVSSYHQKSMACGAFGALGPQASPAVPELVEIYEHNPDVETRWMAADALANIGPAARSAIPALIHGATNVNEALIIRKRSIRALGQVGGDPAMVVPALMQILKEPTGDCPIIAILMLEKLGLVAKPAVPALFELLKNLNDNPKKVDGFGVSGNNLQIMNDVICRAIRAIDPETAAARKSEIDAALSAGKQQ